MKLVDTSIVNVLEFAKKILTRLERLNEAALASSLGIPKPYRILSMGWDTGGRRLVNRLASEEGGWVGLVRVMNGHAPSLGKEWRASRAGNCEHVWYIFDNQTRIAAGDALLDMHQFPEKYGKRQAPTRYRASKTVIEACDFLRKPEEIAKGRAFVPRPVKRNAIRFVEQNKPAKMRA